MTNKKTFKIINQKIGQQYFPTWHLKTHLGYDGSDKSYFLISSIRNKICLNQDDTASHASLLRSSIETVVNKDFQSFFDKGNK